MAGRTGVIKYIALIALMTAAFVSAVYGFFSIPAVKRISGAGELVAIKMEPEPPPISETSAVAGIPNRGPTPRPIVSEAPAKPLIDYFNEGNKLELPVNGATGYSSVNLRFYESPDGAAINYSLKPGEAFVIQEEDGEWWRVALEDGSEGWVRHKYCFINLPDVIPSIVYNLTNTYGSLFRSSGKAIPGVTGETLYDAFEYNARLGREEFTVAALYAMAPKICLAQQMALADGNTLVIYEAFRPAAVQKKVSDGLSELAGANPEVKNGVSEKPWAINLFIPDGTPTNQQGCAIDVSLGQISKIAKRPIGGYIYSAPEGYREYMMPTEVHEMSIAAAALKLPVKPRIKDLWVGVEPAGTMNEPALLLQKYCGAGGLTPLSSEWWHFDDVDCLKAETKGDFFISQNLSIEPAAEEPSPSIDPEG